jgi:hypothetical protein
VDEDHPKVDGFGLLDIGNGQKTRFWWTPQIDDPNMKLETIPPIHVPTEKQFDAKA